MNSGVAYFACGCFWGTEYYFSKCKGVKKCTVGYMGGSVEKPTYQQVCTKKTGHLEAIEVVYDPSEIDYEHLVKYFFEIHDFTQSNGQGPDIGPQYLSAIFYQNENESNVAQQVIKSLQEKGYKVATSLKPFAPFYKAEDYHQKYYQNKGSEPYCHFYKKIF